MPSPFQRDLHAFGLLTARLTIALVLVVLATHVGDTRTLALPAAHTIYYEMGPELRAQMGIADSLIRVSVGIEDEADLIGDFDRALRECGAAQKPDGAKVK